MIIQTEPNNLIIELHGREQFFALRAKVIVPKDTITDVRFEELFINDRKWSVRMPGTYMPRVLMAGSYWTEEGWDFAYASRPRGFKQYQLANVLVVETNQNRYRRIILGCEPDKAKEIIKWWQAKTKV